MGVGIAICFPLFLTTRCGYHSEQTQVFFSKPQHMFEADECVFVVAMVYCRPPPPRPLCAPPVSNSKHTHVMRDGQACNA